MDQMMRNQLYLLRSKNYVLTESISDPSSDEADEEEKHLPLHKRKRSNTSDFPPPTSNTTSSLEQNDNQTTAGFQEPSSATTSSQFLIDESDIIDITGDSNDEDEGFMFFINNNRNELGREGRTILQQQALDSSSMLMSDSSHFNNNNQTRLDCSAPPINTAELVPLRNRTNSDLQSFQFDPNRPAENQVLLSFKSANPSQVMSSNTAMREIGASSAPAVEKETPERWRNRLWPGKAIIAYCRIITRCKPPECTPGERLQFMKDPIKAHWRANEMNKVGIYFDNVMMHSSAFFLLTVEESRAAVTSSDDYEQQLLLNTEVPSSTSNNAPNSSSNVISSSSSTDRALTVSTIPTPLGRPTSVYESIGNNGWLECEIIGIIGTSELGSLPQACDPRLGSVWIVSVAIKTPNVRIQESSSSNSSNNKTTQPSNGSPLPKSKSSNHLLKESSLSGGDFVVLHSNQWNHPILGIIQPWDPDYDLRYGVNFNINTSQHTKYMDTFYNDNCAELTTANILICVDSGEASTNSSSSSANVDLTGAREQQQAEVGGWASQGAIHPGVTFSMAIIGNVLTYIRECQALMSLKLLNPALRDAVLKPLESVSQVHLQPTRTEDERLCPKNIPPRLWSKLSDEYNDSQMKAIHAVCQRSPPASSVCLLQGPPGSGKTKTILGILSVLLAGALRPVQKTTKVIAGSSFRNDSKSLTEQSQILGRRGRSDSVSSDYGVTASSLSNSGADRSRVLVCAPSNTAVDELVFRILTQGLYDSEGYKLQELNVVRIGNSTLLKDQHSRFNGFGTSSFGDSSVYAAPLTEEDYNVMKIVERVSLENIVEDRRKALLASDAKKQLGVSFKYSDIRKQVLEKADIVCCTLSGAGSQPILEVILRITGFKFDAVIIDEAAQAVEPSSLIPFKYNPQLVVLVGDPCQLPATVFSRIAKEANYGQSLFLRLQKSGHAVTMLRTQYRMHPMIAQYPSIRFYSNRLFTDPSVNAKTTHYRPYHDDSCGRFKPFLFHDLLFSREETDGSASNMNRDEGRYILMLYDELVRRYPDYQRNIGIIAPYRAQRRYLMQLFQQRYGSQRSNKSFDTEIATVDGFQGREKDIIIFSCTRSSSGNNAGDSIGFLREWQRLNVAITRAKYALWIVGNSKTLQKDSEWNELISYARRQQCLLSFPSEKSTKIFASIEKRGKETNDRKFHKNAKWSKRSRSRSPRRNKWVRTESTTEERKNHNTGTLQNNLNS